MPTIAAGTSAVITLPAGYAINLDAGASGMAVAPGGLYSALGNFQSIGPYNQAVTVSISVDASRGVQVYNLFRVGGTIPGLVPNVPNATDSMIIGQSAIAASVTGTVSETTLASFQIPGGLLGPNGTLRITTLWSFTNSANNKTLQVRFGGTSFFAPIVTTTASANGLVTIRNRGVVNSQIAAAPTGVTFGLGASAVANATGAIDTSLNQTLLITGTLANSGETITLEGFTAEVLPG